MADLTTSYLGLSLSSPIVLASSALSNKVENLKLAEEHGAGAVVVRSLFEEQIEAVNTELEEAASVLANSTPEATTFFPAQRIGPGEYLKLVEKAKRTVRIPVIASLNCVAPGSWSAYARQIADAGADALEVNVYAVQADPDVTAGEVEARYEEIVRSVVAAVRIPVSVKLSPFFTSLANVVARLEKAGAKGFVLFNRFLQPDISLERLSLENSMALSTPQEMLLPLRWIALLHGRVAADLAASTGVQDAAGVAKLVLAGANVVQVAAALVRNGIPYVQRLRDGLDDWMDKRGFSSLDDCRGTLSQRAVRDAGAFERAQYVHLILSQNA